VLSVATLSRSLLLQLSGQITSLEVRLTRLKDSYKNATPLFLVLLECLRQTVASSHHAYPLLDALDECPARIRRKGVLSVINTIRI